MLYTFTNGADGGQPVGGVIQAPDGTLYGETYSGGSTPCTEKSAPHGCGTVYAYTQAGGIKVLATFDGANGAFGANPLTLIGNTLYGTTLGGGANHDGVIFSVNTDGSNFQVLHQFSGPDGRQPIGALVAINGTLYGITSYSGSNHKLAGVLYAITPGGAFTVLQSFAGRIGAYPTSLEPTPQGTLIGATSSGGQTSSGCTSGCGVIFTYNPANAAFLPYSNRFPNAHGGFLGAFLPDRSVTGYAGGVLFSFNPKIGYTTLALFDNQYGQQGGDAFAGPVRARNGVLYGTVSQGPYGGVGAIYHESHGLLLDLYGFTGGDDGANPQAQPIITTTNDLVGSATNGGKYNWGTLWAITP